MLAYIESFPDPVGAGWYVKPLVGVQTLAQFISDPEEEYTPFRTVNSNLPYQLICF